MKKLIVFFLCLACVLWCVSSCKKKGDPCPPEVDFEMYYMYEYYTSGNSNVPTYEKVICDTIVNGQIVTFEANENGAIEYEWLIGEETETRKGKKIEVDFHVNTINPITIDITLTAIFSSDNNCRNYSNNKKKISKKMAIMLKPAYIGKFRGYDTQYPEQQYTIEIIDEHPNNFYDNYPMTITNLANLFYNTNTTRAGYDYRYFSVWSSGHTDPCKSYLQEYLYGKCYVDNSNNITINYHINYTPDCERTFIKRSHTFVGTRIP